MPAYVIANAWGYNIADNPQGEFGWEYGGALYVCLCDNPNNAAKLHFFKSTDSGQTWSELNAGAGPNINAALYSGVPPFYACYKSGNTIYVIFTRMHLLPGGTTVFDGLSTTSFDLVGEVWSGSISNISAPDWDFTAAVGREVYFSVTNDTVVHSATRSGGMGRIGYASFVGGILGGSTIFSPTGVRPVGAITDSGITQILYWKNSSTRKVFVRSLSGSEVEVVSSGAGEFATISQPFKYTQSGITRFGFVAQITSGSTYLMRFYSAPWATNLSFGAPETIQAVDSSTSDYWAYATTKNIDPKAIAVAADDSTIQVVWTAWRFNEPAQQYDYQYARSAIGSGIWSAHATLFAPPTADDAHFTIQLFSWGSANRINVVGISEASFGFNSVEVPQYAASVSAALSISVSDALSLADFLAGVVCFPNPTDFADGFAITDSVGVGVNVVGGGSGDGGSGDGGSTENVFDPSCVFEFYGLERPEQVEVLPVPKKFDQLGPMRFDKIGKVFGFRARLIQNGTTTTMPFAIYADDSPTANPGYSSPLYASSFAVRPGRDNTYEVQFPKNINTDILRLTLGPVSDSFHRYDVLIKVQSSGMESESRWIPIR